MTSVFFDAGNTLLLYDYDRVAAAVSSAGFPVTAADVMRAEYRARFDVDDLVAPFLLEPHRPVPNMAEIWPYGNFHSHLFRLLGVPARLVGQISGTLFGAGPSLWSVVAPGTPEVLSRLRGRGFRLNVISNSDGSVEGLLTQAGLRGYFDRVFDSHVVGLEKPDPAFFHHALGSVGAGASDSVYLGDFYSIDYLAARNAGMQAILFDRGDLYRHVPCSRITRLGEVEERI